jgi:hypothetical protein
MIQADPIYLVVSGEDDSPRIHFASKFQPHAQGFANAFAHDPVRPRVVEYQTITMGADFYPGSKAFNVRMGREGKAIEMDDKPRIWGFGYMNESTNDSPEVVFHVWARSEAEAVETATEMRDRMARNGWWPAAKTVPE